MIDTVRIELRVQIIPVRGFIGVDSGHVVNTRGNNLTTYGFALGDNGKAFAAAFAPDNNNLALAGLIDRKAAVAAIFALVGRANMTAKIRAVQFDFAL